MRLLHSAHKRGKIDRSEEQNGPETLPYHRFGDRACRVLKLMNEHTH